MSSESVEDYLRAIYSYNEKGELAKNTDLAKQLNVSPPSVTQMLQRLADEGLVEYTPYKGAMLTGKGMAHAQRIVRKHRLLERFLHDVLGMGKNKVHNEAGRLEHGLSDEAAAALCQTLENPDTSPDDSSPLPPCPLDVESCEECPEARKESSFKLLTELANLKPGEEGVIAFVRGGTKARQRLLDMGMTRGTKVKVTNAAPFYGPIEVEVRETVLALGRGLAHHVFVEFENSSEWTKGIASRGRHQRRGRRQWQR